MFDNVLVFQLTLFTEVVFAATFPALMCYDELKHIFRKQVNAHIACKWGLLVVGILLWFTFDGIVSSFVSFSANTSIVISDITFILPITLLAISVIEGILYWKLSTKLVKLEIKSKIE